MADPEIKGQLSQMPKAMDFVTRRRDLTAEFAALRADINKEFVALRTEFAELKGHVGNLPTTWTLMSFAIGAILAAAGLAFTITRVIHP